jgi:hypothetical protein
MHYFEDQGEASIKYNSRGREAQLDVEFPSGPNPDSNEASHLDPTGRGSNRGLVASYSPR